MATSRLLSSFTLTAANNVLRVGHASYTDKSVVLNAGTYVWSLDNETTAGYLDFGFELERAINAAFASDTANILSSAQINGCDVNNASYVEGRVKYNVKSGNELVFDLDHAATTLDERVLGFATGSGDKTSSSQVLWSDYVHRYGYYPLIQPTEDLLFKQARTSIQHSSGGAIEEGITFGNEFDYCRIGFDYVPSALVRIQAAADSTRTSQISGLTTGDTNCAFERFALDLAQNTAEYFYFYPTTTTTTVASRLGAFRFTPGSTLWSKPLERPTRLVQAAGEIWAVIVEGQDKV